MEAPVEQLESKAQIEHSPSPKRDKYYRQSRRWSACLHQANEEAFSPSRGLAIGARLTPPLSGPALSGARQTPLLEVLRRHFDKSAHFRRYLTGKQVAGEIKHRQIG